MKRSNLTEFHRFLIRTKIALKNPETLLISILEASLRMKRMVVCFLQLRERLPMNLHLDNRTGNKMKLTKIKLLTPQKMMAQMVLMMNLLVNGKILRTS
jgi:hypothetical protein